jgi:RND family efflux transporter MFP subunit
MVERLDYVETPYIGQVVADQRAEISSRIMGRVLKVYVKEGECVKAGRLLVSIDESDVQAQVNAIEQQRKQAEKVYESALVQYEAVKKTYERYSALLNQSAITQQEFDQVKAQFESAKAQVEQAKAGIEALKAQKSAIVSNLAYANLTAPFDDCVVQKNVDVGDLAVPGQPLFDLRKSTLQGGGLSAREVFG